MIWGVGCIRSGTKSLAVSRGGLHEPVPHMQQVNGAGWLSGEDQPDEGLAKHAAWSRKRLNTSLVVDAAQSFYIPIIRDVDPCPGFIWVIRDPVDCVPSLVHWEAWMDGHEWATRIPKDTPALEKAAHFWVYCNETIAAHARMAPHTEPWAVCKATDLKAHEHASDHPSLSDAEQSRVMGWCDETWQDVCEEFDLD